MDFKTIELKNIRPYVRFCLKQTGLIHNDWVVAREHRIVAISEGQATFTIGNVSYTAGKNDVFLISAGVPYQLKSDSNCTSYWIYFDLTMENSTSKSRIFPVSFPAYNSGLMEFLCGYRLLKGGVPLEHIRFSGGSGPIKQADKILAGFNSPGSEEHKENLLSGMAICLIADILEGAAANYKSGAFEDVAKKALDFIHKNYNKKISLQDISQNISFHQSYTNRSVKAVTGFSVYKYLQNYRLEKAFGLLTYARLPVSEVAYQVGFTDSKAFSVAFKNYFGTSPSKIKKYNKEI